MSDVDISESPPGLFFAGSDEDDDKEQIPSGHVQGVIRKSPPADDSIKSSPPLESEGKNALFMDDSEDEDFTRDMKRELLNLKLREHATGDSSSERVIPGSPESAPVARTSASSGLMSPRERSPDLKLTVTKPSSPPLKRRRVEEFPVPANSHASTQRYIGEILIPDAWSTTSGRNVVKVNDRIIVKRDVSGMSTAKKSKDVSSGPKKGDGKKQTTLTSMIKATPHKNFRKTNGDTIVRLLNTKGEEFGRLPKDASTWIAKLLDYGIVSVGGMMSDCPERLTAGVTLVVTLHVYFLQSAFQPPTPSSLRSTGVLFREGVETSDESALRERRSSILKLFEVIALKPQAGAKVVANKADEELHREAMKRVKMITEIVGDDEEIQVEDGEDLSKNDIDQIYKRAQNNDLALGEMEPAVTFCLELRRYQKQALLWMHSMETGKTSARESSSMHPLWSQYAFPQEPESDNGIIDLTADEVPFYFNPYSGELSLEFPSAKRDCRGGILADVGMGKTIMLAALIHTSPPSTITLDTDKRTTSKPRQKKLDFKSEAHKGDGNHTPFATLIVAPTSLLSQWAEELERSSKPGTVKVLVWHGQNRLDLEAVLDASNCDNNVITIVITSYGVLASEHAKSEKSRSAQSPIFYVDWLRIILDEAHACKSRSSKTAKAVYALQARRRWAVTGTPIVNKLEDLYSLLKFLDFKPWSDFSFFRSFITIPFLAHDLKALEIVQVILESILLRREKNMLDNNGNAIVKLPLKKVVVEQLQFSKSEMELYNSIYNSVKRKFDRLNAMGLVSKNYTHILAMIMRLRRAVLHPSLVLTPEDKHNLTLSGDGAVDVNELIKRFTKDDDADDKTSSTVFAEGVLENLSSDDAECPICFDVMECPMVVPECMHKFCKDCIVGHLSVCQEKGQEAACPTCSRAPIKASELIEIMRNNTSSSQQSEPAIILRRNDFQYYTKLEALVKALRQIRDQDPCFRAVVFSQFTSFMDLIQIALQRERFQQYRFDGTMDIKKKNAAISEFRESSRKPKVLVISLRAGGVGLNLTMANHVFMMDCWWNAAIENQAVDRVHRIGQDKTVYVTHFIVANTIEGRILQIQKRKTAIVKEAFRGTRGNDSGKADSESLENLKIMFGDDE